MKKINVYTMGGNDMPWRRQLENSCLNNNISFIHPPLYRMKVPDREFNDWKRFAIYNSDIVVLNITKIDKDTPYEVGIVDAINSFGNKHIFVIGIGEQINELQPYISSAIFHYEPRYEDAIDYISTFSPVN